MTQFGKILIVVGAVLVIAGVLLLAGDKLGLGRLPGDIAIKGKNTSFHFPIATSIVVSLVLTLLLNLWLSRR